MDKQFVVALCNESYKIWEKRSNSVIYSKHKNPQSNHIPLPNIGREAHTYFYHIVKNYDYLANLTIFTQADPIAHNHQFFERVDDIFLPYNLPYYNLGIKECYNDAKGKDEKKSPGIYCDYPDVAAIWKKLFKVECPKGFNFFVGALYAVPKDTILRLPKEFYERCLQLSTEGYGPWEFERLWPSIFMRNVEDFLL